MKELVDAFDGLPLLVKCLLCIPFLAIVWWVYRICRSVMKNNAVGIVLAVILLIIGIPFMWLIDLICLLVTGRVLWVD